MQFFFRNCTNILTRTQGKKFKDMPLVKIANKGTILRVITDNCSQVRLLCKSTIIRSGLKLKYGIGLWI